MIHAFETEHARLYGIPGAVVIHNLQFWITRNRANGENFREGRTWTYNSIKAFEKVFDYMTKAQIRHALDKLETAGVIIKGNFNERATDQTSWYAFADEDTFLGGASHLRNIANGDAKNGARVAKNRKSLDTADGNQDGNHTPGGDVSPPLKLNDLLAEAEGLTKQQAHDWLELRKKKNLPLTRTTWDKIKSEAETAGMTPAEAVVTACENNWGSFRAKWLVEEAAGAKKGGGAPWWLSPETKLAKANEVGVGPAHPGEPDSAWQARIQAAIENGGRPPERARPLEAVTIRDPLAGEESKAKVSPENRAAALAAAGIRRTRPDNDQPAQVPA